MADISKKRICADEALASFLALGPSRTLPRLRERYCCEAEVIPPALSTLKRWSMADEWQDRAKEHDIQVASRASEKAIETQATDRASVFDGIQDAVHALLAKLHDALKRVTIKTVEDLDRLAEVIIKLSAHGLDIQRGKLPDPDLVATLVREKMLANGTIDRAAAPPTATELHDAVDKALREYEDTVH